MTPADSAAFLQRARHEAARYGGDEWVFIRELLQNARDAGATRVWLSTDRSRGRDRVACRDDGSGMTFDHARRFLFTSTTMLFNAASGGPHRPGDERDARDEPTWVGVTTPPGRDGYVAASLVESVLADRICFSRAANGDWQISGYVGGGD